MKLAVLSILLFLQLTNEIMGYRIQSKRGYDDDNGFNTFLSAAGIDVSSLSDQLGNDEKVKEALELLEAVGKQWFNAYRQRKLEPITSTLYKMVRTIIDKSNNPDVKKVLKADESILKMLDELNSEKDVSKLFEQIGQNKELLVQAVEVFKAYTEVINLVKNEGLDDDVDKLFEDAMESEITNEFIQSVVQKGLEMAASFDEDVTASQAKPAVLELSNYIIESIANGKLQPILQAILDTSKLIADYIDMNDPKVHSFLNEVLKFEKILKQSIRSVKKSRQGRDFFIRQLLNLE